MPPSPIDAHLIFSLLSFTRPSSSFVPLVIIEGHKSATAVSDDTRVYKYVRTHVHTSIAARSFVYLSRRSCVNASRRLHLIFSPTILLLFSLSSSHSCVCGHRLTPHISVTCYLFRPSWSSLLLSLYN